MSTLVSPETALIVTLSQIVEGEATCHCGAGAVLEVVTEPDGDPGLVCYEHAMEWVDMTLSLTRKLFGPKEK